MHFMLSEIEQELFKTLKFSAFKKKNSKVIRASVYSKTLLNILIILI